MQPAAKNSPTPLRDRFLRLDEVQAVTGLKKSTLYLMMQRGTFVPRVQLTARCVAWPESAVLQWVQERISVSQTNNLAAAHGRFEAGAQ